MTESLILLWLLAGGAWLWSASRAAAEAAAREARTACSRSGVQLLDHSVALKAIKLQRDQDGRLRLWRRYQFDYSRAGHERLQGEIAMLGDQMSWITEPTADEPPR